MTDENKKEGEKDKSKPIVWLSELSKQDIAIAGGKGANLAEMWNAKLPVPPAFIVTAQAYHKFLRDAELKDKILAIVNAIDLENAAELEEKAKEIQQLIIGARMSDELASEISEAYESLGVEGKAKEASELLTKSKPVFVAVRSSATMEDLGSASFAGQMETFLNIKEKDALIEAIKKCWASLFTARAIYYRARKGFSHETSLIAVIVQKMVNAEKAGVTFTINPLTNNKNEIVIEAVFGLGEGIVSGTIEPDNYIVNKSDLRLKSKRLGKKKLVFIKDPKGRTVKKELPENEWDKQVLDDHELRSVANYAVKIEDHYKWPQDIEWAIEEGKVYIVQSRPVTTVEKEMKKVKVEEAKELLSGLAASSGMASGKVKIVYTLADLAKIQEGDILVTKMTNPDMVVTMQRAAAIVTNEGGLTCFTGETKILTDKGFMEIKKVVDEVNKGETLKILSLNPKTMKTCFKKIIRGFERDANNIVQISVSQTGRMKKNILNVTNDHKFFVFNRRNLIKKELNSILSSQDQVCAIDKIPTQKPMIADKFAYIVGALITDGYLKVDYYSKTRNPRREQIVLTQKRTPNKERFISNFIQNFYDVFGEEIYSRDKLFSYGNIQGRSIQGNATDFFCTKLKPALFLSKITQNLDSWVIALSDTSALHFLAGLIEGDGSFCNNRINIYISKENILKAAVLACLKLGILPQVTTNREIYNLQIVEKLYKIIPKCKKVDPDIKNKILGTKLFSAKQLFSDIIDRVNFKGRIKPYVKKNLLIDSRKIERIYDKFTQQEKRFFSKLINSSIRMHRIKKTGSSRKEKVYNLEVEATCELDKNYVVFTSKYTPLLVSNCHAAIVSREVGVPSVVGTKTATESLKEGQLVTVDGTNGKVYEGKIELKEEIGVQPPTAEGVKIPAEVRKAFEELKEKRKEEIKVKKPLVKVNCDLPDVAERAAATGADGVGLVRIEFIIAKGKVHPAEYIRQNRSQEYTDLLTNELEKIAKAFKDKPVWIRTSDIRTDEYKSLEGADKEPKEDNPMIGWHGIRRGLDDKEILKAEFKAIKQLYEKGYKNVGVMLPFLIYVRELKDAKKLASEIGLPKEVEFGVMIETPASCWIIEQLCQVGIDFISFGTNDLTQLTLGIDRNNERLAALYNELHPGVLGQIAQVIKVCRKHGVQTSICGQAGSRPEMAKFLTRQGITSISANIDAVQLIRDAVDEEFKS